MAKNILDKLRPFITEKSVIARSPGRINLIGEHTDYNDGFVLPAAVDKAAYLVVTPRNDDKIELYAADLQNKFQTTIDNVRKIDHSWTNYILGVVKQFQQKQVAVPGFDATLVADVPIGAGLSSSAAVECATAIALDHLCKASMDKFSLVKMAQKAEHEFAGVQCGIMDQFASMFGKKGYAIRLDCRSLDYTHVPLNLDGFKIVLFDTNVRHSLASSEYNTRRCQCEEGVSIISKYHPEVKSLRDVNEIMLTKYLANTNPLVYRRCKYVVEENNRLLNACEKLRENDLHAFGEQMFASHRGLSKEYEVSCEELDFLVDHVKGNPDVLGARMMGGGFGGCTINLIREEAVNALSAKIAADYYMTTKKELKTYIAQTDDGSSIISL